MSYMKKSFDSNRKTRTRDLNFFHLISRDEFIDLLSRFRRLNHEDVEISSALGRVLAEDIFAPEDLPPFGRSTMDGFAVRARDTFGCGESEPALFRVTGEVPMARPGTDYDVGPQEAVRIWTGGALPRGTDAVVMIEYTHLLDENTIEIFKPVAPGENVISQGEDLRRGQMVLEKGIALKPTDLGALSGLGITRVKCFKQPRVAILSTGDELVPPHETPGPGKIRDINSTTLCALVQASGGIPIPLGIVPDHTDAIVQRCRDAVESGADIVLLSGGSSVGMRDFTLDVLNAMDGATILAHGVSIRPGKPTILAKQANRAFFGLPGHVASSIVVFYLLVQPLIRYMSGQSLMTDLKEIEVICGQEFPSVSGREDFVRVSLSKDPDRECPVAFPVWGKSGLINPLVKADGLLVIPRDSEGLEKGEKAKALLF